MREILKKHKFLYALTILVGVVISFDNVLNMSRGKN